MKHILRRSIQGRVYPCKSSKSESVKEKDNIRLLRDTTGMMDRETNRRNSPLPRHQQRNGVKDGQAHGGPIRCCHGQTSSAEIMRDPQMHRQHGGDPSGRCKYPDCSKPVLYCCTLDLPQSAHIHLSVLTVHILTLVEMF